MNDVSIIIVNYKTPQLCIECIESILQYTEKLNYEIILIDNGSDDESYEMFKDNLPKSVILLRSEKNLGFGRANNKAAELANGKYLFFLNSDTLIETNVIHTMKTYLDMNDNVGSVGVTLYNADRRPVKSFGSFPSMSTCMRVALSVLRKNIGIGGRRQQKFVTVCEELHVPFEVDYIMGADLMMRTDLFRSLGGFDNNIFMYFEESDLQLRAKKIGYRQMILPNEHIMHLEGKSIKESNFKRISYNKSMMYYMKKHHRNELFYLFKLLMYIIYWTNGLFDKNYNTEEKKAFISLFNPLIINDYKA
ncbi:glycosyltransferase family 2 protein [uncultured Bacteroides sp.]|uniref:glycosyltransferase family 2 protein n=1 Tax=uncultured Bacteroides sp. TaxID=162156 RepID=UPI0025FAC934|nr:glycosyltransferase family 2 protein [uncultured Bacteroides sp.]